MTIRLCPRAPSPAHGVCAWLAPGNGREWSSAGLTVHGEAYLAGDIRFNPGLAAEMLEQLGGLAALAGSNAGG